MYAVPERNLILFGNAQRLFRIRPVTGYDFGSAETRDDPYPLFHRLREHDPVYPTDWDLGTCRVTTTSSPSCDPAAHVRAGRAGLVGGDRGTLRTIMDSWMMALDGPAHPRRRDLVSRAFTPRAVEAMRPGITVLADGLVSALVDRSGGDIVEHLAFPLPMDVTRIMFGVDSPTWDREVVALFDPARRDTEGGFVQAMTALSEFLEEFVPRRSVGIETDLFAALMAPDEDGNRLSHLERVANAVLLVTAGFETTMSLITLAVWTLLSHPDQRLERLRADWSLARNAVEEVLRYEPAALWTSRFATEDIAVGEVVIPRGSNVLFSSVAADRDPHRFEEPDRFDIGRKDIRPVTFGGGVHSCLGAALARLEAEVAITRLFQRAPSISLVSRAVAWQDGNPSVRRPTLVEVAV